MPRKPKNFVRGAPRNLSKALIALQGAEAVVPASLMELKHKVEAKIETGFRKEMDPYGQAWVPPSVRYLKREIAFDRPTFKLLQRSGGLKRRTQVNIIDGQLVKAVNKAPHAHLVQNGTRRRVPGGVLLARRFLPRAGEMPQPWARDLLGVPKALMRQAGFK